MMTGVVLLVPALLGARMVAAATLTVTPADSYQKIESAQPGDEVVIAPGTYAFRVHLTKAGTVDKPIVIRAQDPAHPPVWDLGGTLVEDAPGSYTAGDRGRGCWQISGGDHYDISGITFANCHNASSNSAGLRYYNGARGIRLRDCVFRGNDNGLTGGTQDSELTAEYCEFDRNGNLAASAPTHNIYIYGGQFSLRYSYVHDPLQAQNFHIRATSSVIEYNWFARGKSYEGDLMTDDSLAGTSAVRQNMLLRGNVIVQAAQPANTSQVIAVYNDGEVAGLSFSLRLVNNTFVGNGGRAALVHLSNADGTTMNAELVNNIVAGTSVVTLVEDPSRGAVSGSNNWVTTGASASGLSASISGSEPGFVAAAAQGFTLAAGSPAIGKAVAVSDPPSAEYHRDEQVSRQRRIRASALDLGAFESTTTSSPSGPYGDPLPTLPDAGVDAAADAPALGTGGVTGTGGRGSGGAGPQGGAGGRGGTSGAADGGLDGGLAVDGGRGGSDGGSSGRGGTLGVGGATGTGGSGATQVPDAAVTAGSGGTSGGLGGADAAIASGTGGTLAAGGAVGGGGTTGPARNGSSGCSCTVEKGSPSHFWLGTLALAGLLLRSRSRRRFPAPGGRYDSVR